MEALGDRDGLSELFADVIETMEKIRDVFDNDKELRDTHPLDRQWLEDFTTALTSWGVDVRISVGGLLSIQGTALARRVTALLQGCQTFIENAFTEFFMQRSNSVPTDELVRLGRTTLQDLRGLTKTIRMAHANKNHRGPYALRKQRLDHLLQQGKIIDPSGTLSTSEQKILIDNSADSSSGSKRSLGESPLMGEFVDLERFSDDDNLGNKEALHDSGLLEARVSSCARRLKYSSLRLLDSRDKPRLVARHPVDWLSSLEESRGLLLVWFQEFGSQEGESEVYDLEIVLAHLAHVERQLTIVEGTVKGDLAEDSVTSPEGAINNCDEAISRIKHTIRTALSTPSTKRARHSEELTSVHAIPTSNRPGIEYFITQLRRLRMHNRDWRVNAESRIPEFVWNSLPQLPDLTDLPVWPEVKDGAIIDFSTLEDAKNVLQAYYTALEAFTGTSNPKELDDIKSMPKIFMTLHTMEAHKHVNAFLISHESDAGFPFDRDFLRKIIGTDGDRFYAEQFRIHSRPWYGGDHLELAEGEPLPFRVAQSYPLGVFSSVYRVVNQFDNQSYVLRYPHYRDTVRVARMEVKAQRLVRIHEGETLRHVVQVVKTFERGTDFGILVTPAPTNTLENILRRYTRDTYRGKELAETLRMGIGCLGLSLLSNPDLFQREYSAISPASIFCMDPSDVTAPYLLWSNPGLLDLDYFRSDDSRMYIAPEVRTFRSTPWGARSEDVFSFGCVIFEILGTLLKAEYDPQHDERFPERFHPYYSHIRHVHRYIDKLISQETEKHRKRSHVTSWVSRELNLGSGRTDPSFVPLLELVKGMIQEDEGLRPSMNDFVLMLAEMHAQGLPMFCRECVKQVKELIRKEKQREDTYEPPREKIKEDTRATSDTDSDC